MKIKQTIMKANMRGEYKEDYYSSIHKDNKLLKKYIHDIRNNKIFSKEILHNINSLSYEDRFDILVVYNEMISYFNDLFNEKLFIL